MFKLNWNRFDHIFCIHFLPFKERMDRLKNELRRVDLLDNDRFSFEFTVPSEYDKVIFNYTKNVGRNNLLTVNQLNLVLGTYKILMQSKIMDYERILIIEDDIAFLKNKKEIQNIIDKLPDEYDICLFDKFKDKSITIDEYQSYIDDKINDCYSRYKRLKSCGCYSLTKKCIEKFIKMYETFLMITDEYTSIAELKTPLNKIFSVKNLACQISYIHSSNILHGGKNCIHDVYKLQGLDYREYNVGNFNYGDIIEG